MGQDPSKLVKKTEVKEIEVLMNTKKEPKKRPAGRREQTDLDPEGMEE